MPLLSYTVIRVDHQLISELVVLSYRVTRMYVLLLGSYPQARELQLPSPGSSAKYDLCIGHSIHPVIPNYIQFFWDKEHLNSEVFTVVCTSIFPG